ncbi:MAG: YdeI/OmpD-associated family protein [Acetobacteraceae bacterium]|nr:YdeI/OmpD-associated family protein [Acetobacteraceae bacterium]
MSLYPHAFEGALQRHGVGRDRKVWYAVLFLPPALAAELPFDRFPRLRVEGEIADQPVSGAWMPVGDGRRYFIVSPEVRKAAGAGLGAVLEMRFRVADQDAVEVPEALVRELERRPDLRARWDALTPGRRRGLAHLVRGARTEPTRQRRVAEVVAAILDGR